MTDPSHRITLALALALGGCFDTDDTRAKMTDIACTDDMCSASWDGSDERSRVFPAADLELLDQVDPTTVWPCDPDPEVDLCTVVDTHGHLGCVWVDGDWAAMVAPVCAAKAIEGIEWMPVGLGMAVGLLD